ncbi:MAG: hypothetical protein ACKVS8_06525 [Phycisphaerales bacterium]
MAKKATSALPAPAPGGSKSGAQASRPLGATTMASVQGGATGSQVENKTGPASPRHDQIALAAYLRWCAHGGDEAGNWFAAEHELKGTSVTRR